MSYTYAFPAPGRARATTSTFHLYDDRNVRRYEEMR